MITRGSEWHRWEPHIHAPGTILNNQFGGNDPWGDYLSKLESLTPKIEAIAVTDYYVTETYQQVLTHKASGRLPDVKVIFPNIELRLDVAAKTGFVNLHLLVSPEASDHLAQASRILSRLQFRAFDDCFDCSPAELIRLGRRADPTLVDNRAALAHGATQFKVNFDRLRTVYSDSDWARNNILVAVAGGAGDGTSGVRQAADATVRLPTLSSRAVLRSGSSGWASAAYLSASCLTGMTAANRASMAATRTTSPRQGSRLRIATHG